MGNFIIYDLCFRFPLQENEDIIFENFSEKYVEKITIFKGEEAEDYPKRRMRIDFKSEELTSDILKNIDNFILEFLHKLTLDMKTLFPFYKEEQRKIGNIMLIKDSIEISDSIVLFEKITNNTTLIHEDIKFKENLENYRKMIRVLGIADSDPVTTFLILYDWLKGWVNPSGKQEYVTNYIIQNKENLSQFCKCNYEIIENTNRGYSEDEFTKLRNDISHPAERITEKESEKIKRRASILIKPLVFTMTYFLKNN